MSITLPSVKSLPVKVCENWTQNALLDLAIDCGEANAVEVDVFVNGVNPSVTITVKGSSAQGGNYLTLPDTNATQTAVTANKAFDCVVGSRWIQIDLSAISGTFGVGSGFTIFVTPYFSPGSARVAASIVVATLSAIQTNTGALNVSGVCTIGTGGALRSGQTAYDTGTGFWLEYNGGTPRFSIGVAGGNGLTWDGTTLAVTGAITMQSGSFAGVVTIGSSGGIYQGSGTFNNPNNGLKLYSSGTFGQLDLYLNSSLLLSLTPSGSGLYLSTDSALLIVKDLTPSGGGIVKGQLSYTAGLDGLILLAVNGIGLGRTTSALVGLSGLLNLPNAEWITARNAGNTADVNMMQVDASNVLQIGSGGDVVNFSTGAFGTPSTQAFGDAATTGSGPTVAASDHKHGMPVVTAPNSITACDGGANLTTSGATELTIVSRTITNPSVAGQILIIATTGYAQSSVAGDVFTMQLYFGGVMIASGAYTSVGSIYGSMTMSGIVAVATSGSQQIKTTVQRSSGTGTLLLVTGWQSLAWVILPAANTTA